VSSRYGDLPADGRPHEPSTVDLHTHTRRSDGVLEPVSLVEAAGRAGVQLLAITDHDSLAGFRELNGRVETIAPGLELLAGVEINAVTSGIDGLWENELHVLGYGMDPFDEGFERLLRSQRVARRRRFERAVDRLRELGLGVDAKLEALDRSQDDALGRPTLARALVSAGLAASVEDAFERILGQGRPGYVVREGVGPSDAIAAITAAGGLASLAHFRDAPARRTLISDLMAVGLRGLEVHYRRFDEPTVAALAGVADELRLVRTGGSDYHGDDETYAEAHAGLRVPAAVATTLRATLAAP
jgi:predicted metal-dependent phosphoesterase TrpH